MSTAEAGPLTLADWDALGETEIGYDECVAGVLVHMPTPRARHQIAAARLCHVLDRHLPDELVSVPSVDVILVTDPLTVRAPDVVVIPTALLESDPHHLYAGDVRLAVEVVEVHTRRADRVTKLKEYAEAGIAEYWILEHEPWTLSTHVLDSGVYRSSGAFRANAELAACGVQIRIDLDGLTLR